MNYFVEILTSASGFQFTNQHVSLSGVLIFYSAFFFSGPPPGPGGFPCYTPCQGGVTRKDAWRLNYCILSSGSNYYCCN